MPKWYCLLNGADPSFINSLTGSVCRAKCSNILQDINILEASDHDGKDGKDEEDNESDDQS